jgi:hypothetical protein
MPQYARKTRQMVITAGVKPAIYAERYFTYAGQTGTLVGKLQYVNKGALNSWPSTVSPFNTVAPAISGTPTSGNVQTCSTGTWVNNAGIQYAYAWFRDGTTPIGTAVNTYTLAAADIGHNVTCKVTATNSGGYVNSAISAPVNPASRLAPGPDHQPVGDLGDLPKPEDSTTPEPRENVDSRIKKDSEELVRRDQNKNGF